MPNPVGYKHITFIFVQVHKYTMLM